MLGHVGYEVTFFLVQAIFDYGWGKLHSAKREVVRSWRATQLTTLIRRCAQERQLETDARP